jgi:hypothetical protein
VQVTTGSGLPPTHDSRCEVCGRSGQVRHFPGASPTSGTWCEAHYRRLLWLSPLGHYGRWVWLAGLYAAAAVFVWLARGGG